MNMMIWLLIHSYYCFHFENHRHHKMYIDRDRIHVQLHNMDIVLLYKMIDNDNPENDYHILLMNNNNIFHKNFPNEYNNNHLYMILNDHDHMDNMYDVFVLIVKNYYDDLIRFVDDYVDDEMSINANDEKTNDLYLPEKETYMQLFSLISILTDC